MLKGKKVRKRILHFPHSNTNAEDKHYKKVKMEKSMTYNEIGGISKVD